MNNEAIFATADLKVFHGQTGLAQATMPVSFITLSNVNVQVGRFFAAPAPHPLSTVVASGLTHIRHAQMLPEDPVSSVEADAVIASEWARIGASARPLARV